MPSISVGFRGSAGLAHAVTQAMLTLTPRSGNPPAALETVPLSEVVAPVDSPKPLIGHPESQARPLNRA